jgi:hypothetical protein
MPKVYEPHPGVATQVVVLAAKISGQISGSPPEIVPNPAEILRMISGNATVNPLSKTDALTSAFGTD